ncbi:hypothetical protein COBT_002742, partial [Conglomerata obtusa]
LHFDKKPPNSYNVRTVKNNKEYRYSYLFEVIYVSDSGKEDLEFVDCPIYNIQTPILNDFKDIILHEKISMPKNFFLKYKDSFIKIS